VVGGDFVCAVLVSNNIIAEIGDGLTRDSCSTQSLLERPAAQRWSCQAESQRRLCATLACCL